MNTFSENPLFLFVDELADVSPNFATDGKIVELFDTGCDARTPGAAFEIEKEAEAIIQSEGSTLNNIPNVRKPLGLPLCQKKTLDKKNTSPARHEEKIQIAATSKLPKQSKPLRSNSKLKDEVSTSKRNITDVKRPGLDSVVGNRSNAEVSAYSNRVGVSPDQQKAKSNSTRSWMSSKYGDINRTVKSQLISSSIPKQSKVPEPRSTICSTFGERVKTSLTKSVKNSQMILSKKSSNVTSQTSLNQRVEKFVNRAVDKDSLSNCSRQLEMAKTLSKTGYASRLPRLAGTAKFRAEEKSYSKFPVPLGISKEANIEPESKTALMKIVGGTDHELQKKGLQCRMTAATTTVNSWKRRDRPEGETTSTDTLFARSMYSSQRKHGDDVEAKLLTKNRDADNQDMSTLSSSRSKTTASKMPLPRFGRNLLSVQNPRNPDEIRKVDQVSNGLKSKLNERISSKKEETDKALCQDSEKKLSAGGRVATNLEKVPARPSAKNHNLNPSECDAKKTTISLKTKLSEPRNPSIVPKLMDEFRLRERKEDKASKCSPKSLAVSSVSQEGKMANGKLKTDSSGKPPRTSGILSDQLNEPLSKFSDRVQEVLDCKAPLLSKVTEGTGISHRSVDRSQQGKPKVDVELVSLSGIRAVEENDEEIELKTVFEDMSVSASLKPTPGTSRSHSRAVKVKESRPRRPTHSPSVTGSKVPRPVSTKRILRKEIVRNFSTRTCSKKQESSAPRGTTKNSAKTNPITETKPSTPPTKKFVGHVSESKNLPKESIVAEEGDAEDVIPIMNPALYNIHSFATQYRSRGNLENTVPQETLHGRKLETCIDGHEQAYLRGRAIGLKVASMARAAKENLKREFVRSGLKTTTSKSLPDKSQEIVDIGVSVIEKVLAEKDNWIHSPSVQGDQVLNYFDFDENSKWNTRRWFV